MRLLCFAIILFFSCALSGQSAFQKQFRDLISDSASGFSRFRGEVIIHGETTGKGNYTEYGSLFILENTSRNNITCIESPELTQSVFYAMIADSLKGRKSEKVCNEWKNALELLLGKHFNVKKYETKNYNPAKYGWTFFYADMTITILSVPIKDTVLYKVWLAVSYSAYKVQ